MARKRMIDPEFWLDEELSKLSAHARLLYIGLWGICDDNHATLPNRPDWVKAQVFPYENIETRRVLAELSNAGKIILFLGQDGHEYWFIKNFLKHQRIDRPSSPKYPAFTRETVLFVGEITPTLDESSTSTRPEVKLSKVKLSKSISHSKAGALQKYDPLGAEVIKEFEAIDPKNKGYYANKTQRAACDFLLKEYGLDETLKRIKVLPKTNQLSYFPTITTPVQLRDKWVQLQDAVTRKRGEVEAKKPKII